MRKNKVITFTESTDYRHSIANKMKDWQEKNRRINIVSTETTQGTFTQPARVTVIYNED